MSDTSSRRIVFTAALALTMIAPLSACAPESGVTATTPESVTGEHTTPAAVAPEDSDLDEAEQVAEFEPVQAVILDRVISGEYVVVTVDEVQYPVRLLGVDVPDSHVDEALTRVERAIAESGSQDLWVEFDDQIGRLDDPPAGADVSSDEVGDVDGPGLQGYVWTSHPVSGELYQMLNLVQVEEGLAKVIPTGWTSHRHHEQFRRAEGYARDRGFGAWEQPPASVEDAVDV